MPLPTQYPLLPGVAVDKAEFLNTVQLPSSSVLHISASIVFPDLYLIGTCFHLKIFHAFALLLGKDQNLFTRPLWLLPTAQSPTPTFTFHILVALFSSPVSRPVTFYRNVLHPSLTLVNACWCFKFHLSSVFLLPTQARSCLFLCSSKNHSFLGTT